MTKADHLLPQPTVPGKVRGIISMDPVTLQCGVCGRVLENTTGRRTSVFIILAGFLFCTLEKDGPRRCPDCLTEHRKTCKRCER